MDNVTVIIPAYNETSSISGVVKAIEAELKKLEMEFEILIVDDGSTDGTSNAVPQNERIRVLSHEENQGYGASLKTGIDHATYDTIIITDADGTYPESAMAELVKHADGYDMIVGARTGRSVNIPWMRKPAKWVLNKLANYLAEKEIPDLNSGLRLFNRKLVKKFFHLLPNGFSFTTTITLALLTNGYKIKYIPIDYHKRSGRSKIRPIGDTVGFLILIVRTVLCFNPLRVFVPLFLFFFVIGMAKFIYDVVWSGDVGEVALIFLVAALQTAVVGMLADLIDRRMGGI